MTLPTEMIPLSPHKVMDLLRDTGMDVSDWADMKGGEARAASNPKYCYEWAYRDDALDHVILNLWLASMREKRGRVWQELNAREAADKQRNSTGKRRALRMDAILSEAARRRLSVRVIICDGARRGFELPNAKASRVTNRLLDPLIWHVKDYSDRTGRCILERGIPQEPFLDQFSLQDAAGKPAERRLAEREQFVRSSQVRQQVLARARGLCELCRQPGFQMVNGGTYLETHHVVPLAEDGADMPSNVVALCPNHHREAHHGVGRDSLRKRLALIAMQAAR